MSEMFTKTKNYDGLSIQIKYLRKDELKCTVISHAILDTISLFKFTDTFKAFHSIIKPIAAKLSFTYCAIKQKLRFLLVI